jgi:Rieske Fe-S protein
VAEHLPDETPHLPPPSLWPAGFAVGIAVALVGLIVSPLVVTPIGLLIALVFGALWARDAMHDSRPAPLVEDTETVEVARPEAPAVPAHQGRAAMPAPAPGETFPRSKFLEGATLGLGAVIGGLVTVPALGFAILPAFVDQEHDPVDIGGLDDYPEGQWMIATFLLDPGAGEVSRRTAYVRNNGMLDGKPSFTALSNRCVHLGCPVQANGLPQDEKAKTFQSTAKAEVRLIPVQPAGFSCPCHGGSYDTEGNRTAGPPVRALDRYEFSIRDSRVYLGNQYSVSSVKGEGSAALISKYGPADPGQHVDGPEQILYPIMPEDVS